MVASPWRLLDDEQFNPLAERVNAQTAEARLEGDYDLALKRLREAATGQTGQFTAAEIEAQAPETVEWCRQQAARIVRQINDACLGTRHQRAFDRADELVVQELLNDVFGLGPLQKLLELPNVEDIAIVGPRQVFYKAQGSWQKSDVTFRSSEALLYLLNHAVSHTQRTVSAQTPIVDATLKEGHRISIVGPPIADPWPSAVIRLRREKSLSAVDLVASGGEDHTAAEPVSLPNYFAQDQGRGMFSALAMTFLTMAITAGQSVLVIGGTGVGKTTVLSALGKLVPPGRRMIIIEDTPELNLMRDNCQRFVTRPASLEGLSEVAQRDLVRVGLRQRPDALTLGEARGAEVLDLLKALRTGHRNGLTSIHANSVEDVFERVLYMLTEAQLQVELRADMVAGMVAKAFDLVIMLKRLETGRRYVEEIAEFTGGIEGVAVVRQTLFAYDRRAQRLKCTGRFISEVHEEQLGQCGYSYQMILDAARERHELG